MILVKRTRARTHTYTQAQEYESNAFLVETVLSVRLHVDQFDRVP